MLNRVFFVLPAGLLGALWVRKEHEEPEPEPIAYTVPPPGAKWDHNWDKRAFLSEGIKRGDPVYGRNIILVRNGQCNPSFPREEDHRLTETGRRQAELVGLRLKELALPFSRIQTSSMSRAMETADIISKHFQGVPIFSSYLFTEGQPVVAEPSVEPKPPHTYHEVEARLEAAFRRLFYRPGPEQTYNSYEILVCHKSVINYFVCRALQFPVEAFRRFLVNHCSITWIVIGSNGIVSLRSLGEFGFLPPNLITSYSPSKDEIHGRGRK